VNAPLASPFAAVPHFAAAHAMRDSGPQLRAIREAAPHFRTWFKATGQPTWVGTFDLTSLPYPSRFGLLHAGMTGSPWVNMTNRLLIVQWRDADHRLRTMLWEPSDVETARNCPFYAQLAASLPKFVQGLISTVYTDLLTPLQKVGISPESVDYLAFDHLHIQDCRRLLGTRDPAPDLGSPDAPLRGMFPNARMIVQQAELDLLADPHPLQTVWYQPETYHNLRDDALIVVEGDVLLGPGVALLHTPGHTPGNQSLVVNTQTGIWATSENAISAESLTPEHSRIPGLRRWRQRMNQEVVLNGNTIEATARQYNSVMTEKLIVDPSARDPRFLQFFPSSELTAHPINGLAQPTFVHRAITHGQPTPTV
jgi:hypothetical protein